MECWHEGVEDGAVAVAPVVARFGHQPLEERCGNHQARPGSEFMAALCGDMGLNVHEPLPFQGVVACSPIG